MEDERATPRGTGAEAGPPAGRAGERPSSGTGSMVAVVVVVAVALALAFVAVAMFGIGPL